MSDSAKYSPLGQEVEYKDEYDPGLLFAIKRAENRSKLALNQFEGLDLWQAYEVSWLNTKGKPQVRQASFFINANSENIVESKSFKLYLNSFNQSRFDDEQQVIDRIQKDIAACANGQVRVEFQQVSLFFPQQDINFQYPSDVRFLDEIDVEVSNYHVDAELLKADTAKSVQQTYVSHLLKSNCPVTGQPDWGSVIISLKGAQLDEEALLKFIISFRQHNEFHEHCVEEIFTALQTRFNPENLMVAARYVRRGGLDINPIRVANMSLQQWQWVREIRTTRQ